MRQNKKNSIFFSNFANKKHQTLVIMKKYIQPIAKRRITPMQPFAIDLHSGIGDKEQYSNRQDFEEELPLPSMSKNIWGE